VRHVLAGGHSDGGTKATKAIADMIAIAFFFLLCPGEYTGDWRDSDPFRMVGVQIFISHTRYLGADLLTIPAETLHAATGVSLTFTTQKKAVQGKIIHHRCSGSLLICPVKAVIRRLLHLCDHTTDITIPLASYHQSNKLCAVATKDITLALRLSVASLRPTLCLLPEDISTRSLPAGRAMALLWAKVDKNVILLLGRWRSNVMMWYLHIQAQPVMKHFGKTMLLADEFQMVPGQTVPSQ
jgi:hypothetical protein